MDIELNPQLDEETKEFYINTLKTLNQAGIPYLLGGAYALANYAGIYRHTRDLDLFVRKQDCASVLDALKESGYHTELTFPHWLGKAYLDLDPKQKKFIDIIFNSGNGLVPVDDYWFDNAVDCVVFGLPVKLVPPEEIIWSKAFIMERERYDGGDIAHLLLSMADKMDWQHLISRFGEHWPVLLAHLIIFNYIYPNEVNRIPPQVMNYLLTRARSETDKSVVAKQKPGDQEDVCRGTLLSREQYLVDIGAWHFADARAEPMGNMSHEHLEIWTKAIASK